MFAPSLTPRSRATNKILDTTGFILICASSITPDFTGFAPGRARRHLLPLPSEKLTIALFETIRINSRQDGKYARRFKDRIRKGSNLANPPAPG